MKKHLLFFVCAFLLLTLTSSSQVFFKKDKLFGATAGLNFSSDNTDPSNSLPRQYSRNIAFYPSFSWAVKNNLAMGIRGNFSYYKLVAKGLMQNYLNNSLQVGSELFLRKYKILKDRFGLFFNHGINVDYTKSTVIANQDKINGRVWQGGYNFTPGAFYKFGERFLGEASFGGASIQYTKNSDGTKSFDAGINFLSYFNVGIQYIIHGKKS